jgi:hypothetical protein
MKLKIRRADYFYFSVRDRPGEAYQLLTHLAAGEVNLLAFSAVPLGPERAQLTLFPDRVEQLAAYAEKTGLVLDGPHPAILIQGDDKLGALADVHSRLAMSKINVYASTGVTDGSGAFGYILYVQPRDIEEALAALGG